MPVKTASFSPPKNKFKIPQLIIPNDIYRKIMFWVDQSNFECSWLGTVDHDKENNLYYIMEVFLLEQENGAASTDLDQNEIAKLLYEQRDNPYDIKWWGHSHVKMDVFWSATDISTMEILSEGGWFLSTVFNQHRKHRSAFTQLSPVPIMLDELSTTIYDFVSETESREWKTEYDAKVKKKVYVSPPTTTTSRNGTGSSKEKVGDFTPPRKPIPQPANMPDWKQYATDKWREGLHAAEVDEMSKSIQEIMMEADSAPSDPFEDLDLFRSKKPEPLIDDEFVPPSNDLSPQEIEYLNQLYDQYHDIKVGAA